MRASVFLLVSSLLITSVSSAVAQQWDLLGVSGASKEVRKSLNNALLVAERMQDRFDKDIRKYLADLDNKIATIDQAAKDRIAQIDTAVREIEAIILRDVLVVIREAECAALRTAEDIERRMPGILRDDVRLIRYPYPVPYDGFFRNGVREEFAIDVEARRPAGDIFFEIESKYELSFEAMKPNDQVRPLVNAYEELALLAQGIACHPSEAGKERWMRTYAKYNALVDLWVNTPGIRVD